MNCGAKKHMVSPLVLAPLARARGIQHNQQPPDNTTPHNQHPTQSTPLIRPTTAPPTSFANLTPAPPPPPFSNNHHQLPSTTPQQHAYPPQHSTAAAGGSGSTFPPHSNNPTPATTTGARGRGRGRNRTRSSQIIDLPQPPTAASPAVPAVQVGGPHSMHGVTMGVGGGSLSSHTQAQVGPATYGQGVAVGGLTELLLGDGDSNSQAAMAAAAAVYGSSLSRRSTPDGMAGGLQGANGNSNGTEDGGGL